jgi:hypothetical protein
MKHFFTLLVISGVLNPCFPSKTLGGVVHEQLKDGKRELIYNMDTWATYERRYVVLAPSCPTSSHLAT